MPQSVPGYLGATVGNALQKGLQWSKRPVRVQRIRVIDRVEAQSAAKIVVDKLRDGSAPELVAELDIVLA